MPEKETEDDPLLALLRRHGIEDPAALLLSEKGKHNFFTRPPQPEISREEVDAGLARLRWL